MKARPKKLEHRMISYLTASRSAVGLEALKNRLCTWSIYGTATAAALAGATSASAGIIYSGQLDDVASVHTSFAHGVSSGIKDIGVPGRPFSSIRMGVGHFSFPSFNLKYGAANLGMNNGYMEPQRLAAGALITGAGRPGAARLAGKSGLNSWQGANVTGYLAAEFATGIAVHHVTTSSGRTFTYKSPSGFDNGWLKLKIQDLNGDGYPDSMTLLGYAYNDVAGASILAGDTGASANTTPEPSTAGMLLLALGAAGVTALKRSRKTAQ
jgi:hypothetical protein